MNDDIRLMLEKVVAPLSGTLDWYVALYSAVTGLGLLQLKRQTSFIMVLVRWTGIGVAVRKLITAYIRRPFLKRKVRKIRNLADRFLDSPRKEMLLRWLDFEVELWEEGLSSDAGFNHQLNNMIHDIRRMAC